VFNFTDHGNMWFTAKRTRKKDVQYWFMNDTTC